MSIDRILAIIGVLVGIIGLGAAWYFYRASLPTRTPTFLVDPLRAVLVDGSNSATSDIIIQYKGHPVRSKAVNVVRVYFWNSGNTAITKADILRIFTITISGDAEILETKTLKVSRDLTGITFDTQENTRNTANINFELLETDDGAALQIIYAGPRDAELAFDGITMGAPKPTVKMAPYSKYPEQIFKTLSHLVKGLRKDVISYVSLVIIAIIFIMAYAPFLRNFLYRNIFGSKRTNDEIELSAIRFAGYSALAISVLFNVLMFALPPDVGGEIPSVLMIPGN